ncbi:MAG: DUF1353 domain-containing protein [Pelagimonas sp.]|uniref:DUF1353 domain-containing protein n=1 Tax=Pelagimonas sp. TaxID=2073170 RepID=UPI003D6BA2CE
MKRLILLFVILLALAGWTLSRTGLLAWLNVDAEWGYFTDRPLVELLEADRRMALLRDVTYVDPGGTSWTTPAGYKTDGASIPQVFWSFVGGPFTGPYRDAAIIHDWYVETMERTSEDTHRVFYYANRASGLSEFEAKRLYLAVLVGGRKWGGGNSSCYAQCHTIPDTYSVIGRELVLTPNVSEKDAAAAMSWLEASDRSFEDLEEYVATKFPSSLFGHEGLQIEQPSQ